MSANEGISRRELIRNAGVIGVGALALGASSSLLTGCSNVFDYENEYLPLGSIVELTDYLDKGVKWMIVQRRPYVSEIQDTGTGETIKLTEDGVVRDYAAILYPFGLMSNFAGQSYQGEYIFFDREHIAQVDFVGYIDDNEKTVAPILNQAYSDKSSVVISELLVEQYIRYLGQDPEKVIEQSNSGDN